MSESVQKIHKNETLTKMYFCLLYTYTSESLSIVFPAMLPEGGAVCTDKIAK